MACVRKMLESNLARRSQNGGRDLADSCYYCYYSHYYP